MDLVSGLSWAPAWEPVRAWVVDAALLLLVVLSAVPLWLLSSAFLRASCLSPALLSCWDDVAPKLPTPRSA